MSPEVVFDPSAIGSDPAAVKSWRGWVDGFRPAWVTRWLDGSDQPLAPARRQRLLDGKSGEAVREGSWLSYLCELGPYYGYPSEAPMLAAAEWGSLPLVELQTQKVQDLTMYLPLHVCKGLFVLPFSRIAGTGLINCAVLEPGFLVYVDELTGWVRNRWVSQQPVPGMVPGVFQFYLAEPKAFTTFLSSVERSRQVLGVAV